MYFLQHPDSVILIILDIIGWGIFLIGFIKLVIIIKDQITIGSGINNTRKVIISILLFFVGLIILIAIGLFGSILMP